MKGIRVFISVLITVSLFFLLNNKAGDIPPIGKFLDPFHGFWQNAEGRTSSNREIKIKQLSSSADILFDDHMVPHIFAKNDYDLYFAQGYVTAKDRLWQMDFQTRFAAGRLSEVVGEKAQELDKYQRRMGMTYGAEQMLKALDQNPKLKAITQAYADGVNAYISSLKPGDYPIEFKILAYQPEKWELLNTGLLLKLLSATLTAGSDEFYMSNILKKFGFNTVNDLFPNQAIRSDPIIPVNTRWPFTPVETPKPSTTMDGLSSGLKTKMREEGIGSNNWAVSGSKTLSGYPILANDPHLDLTFPAIWYQMQMVAPGVNVYGVTIPGAPCVIIGFNESVAWGVTNVGADVLDWYTIKFKDNSYKQYWHDEQWKEVKQRIETIQIRGGKAIQDTVYYTHHGPVVYLPKEKPAGFSKVNNVPEGNALRWVAHLPSSDIATFYYLNRASHYQDYLKALSSYTAPAQNFVFASIDNDIAISPTGYFPLKWQAQGKFILDGSKTDNDWQGRIPHEHNPLVKNPNRGFVSSANQAPTDASYPYYLNWEFAGYERGHRINTRLAGMNNITIDSLRHLQNDNYSILAEDVLSILLTAVNQNDLTATQHEAFDLVRSWRRYYNANEIGASIFDVWHKDLFSRIWDDEFGDQENKMRYPSRDRTVEMVLNESDAVWFDNIHTPETETRDQLIHESFKFTIDSLMKKLGPLGKKWEWGSVKGTHVPHLAGISGFGSSILLTGGSKNAVNALGEKNGPSWRMIVELGKDPKGYGTFPGGQSGNPGSFYYDDLLNSWTIGQLNELLYLRSVKDKSDRIKSKWHLTK